MEITFENVNVGDQYKLLYPLERGDGIEFSEGVSFDVIEKTAHPDGSEIWHSIRLRSHEKGHHWKALPVPVPKHQPDYLHYLNININILNKSFEQVNNNN